MSSRLGSMTARLLVPLLSTVLGGFAVQAILESRRRAEDWSTLVAGCASRTSHLIERSTHYGMLLNRKDDVRETFRKIGQAQGVAAVRVFAPDGTIVFSSAKSEEGQSGNLDEGLLALFHADKEPASEISERKVVRTSKSTRGEGVFGLARPIVNHPECSTAACHEHPAADRVLGVLDVQMSLSTLEKVEREARFEFLATTFVVALLVAMGVVVFVQRTIRGPVSRLRRAADRVAAGDLSAAISVEREDEIGDLAASFNTMTGELRKSQEELSRWSSELEARVAEKADRIAALQEQRQNLDKMASLGRLAAVMAHELNNPLGGILTYAKLVQRKLASSGLRPELFDELSRYLGLVQSESTRCGELVRNLLSFAGRGPQSVAEFDANELLDRIALLVRPQAARKNVTLEFGRLAPDARVLGIEGELQQALLAIVLNGIEAVGSDGGGRVGVEVSGTTDQVEFTVRDNGVGIAPDVLSRIFDPFFTTKEEIGVGIGLAVAYGVARRHGGEITVMSEVGRGSEFRMRVRRRTEALEATSSADAFMRSGEP